MNPRSISEQETIDLEPLMQDHFDRKWGAPYWLNRRRELPFDPLSEIRSSEDLFRFGPFPEEDLRRYPAIDFVPRKYHTEIPKYVYSESGGTTGPPKGVYFSPSEFWDGFVDPFLQICRKVGWPLGAKWLFLGPSGPHIIGKVLEPICRELGSPPPFRIDFDPRWSLRLTDRSVSKTRYLDHLVDQAMHLFDKEQPEVLFGTPTVLRRIAERVGEEKRLQVQAVHYGGTSLSHDIYREFRERLFPNAVHLAGYGNSLVGVAFEAGTDDSDRLRYFPASSRHLLRVIPIDRNLSLEQRFLQNSAVGEEGQVVVTRLDSTCFLPNLVERDQARWIVSKDSVKNLGWCPFGLYNPRPLSANVSTQGALY